MSEDGVGVEACEDGVKMVWGIKMSEASICVDMPTYGMWW